MTDSLPIVWLPDRRWVRSPTGAIVIRVAIAIGIVLLNWLIGQGLDLAQRPAAADEVGRDPASLAVPVLAVLRGSVMLRYNDPAVSPLVAGDALIYAATAAAR